MRSAVLFCLVFVYAISGVAQNRQLSFEQAFKSAPTNINKSLPVIKGWADDEHYIEMQVDARDGKSKWMTVDVKTGKGTPYVSKEIPVEPAGPAAYGLDSIKNFT